MAHYTGYRFPIPEARQLASWEGVVQDLTGVLEYCARLENLRSEPFDSVLWEAVCAAAVVRYARCFSTGSREPLSRTLLSSAPEHLRTTHEYVVAVRSKHIAHPVNEFEENDVTVMLRDAPEGTEISGIGAHHSRVSGLAFGDPARLQELAEWVVKAVRQKIAEERPRLLEIAQQRGVEAVKAFGLPGVANVALESAAHRVRRSP